MTAPRFPLRINVGFLLNQPIGTSRDFSFEFPLVQVSSDFQMTNFKGLAHISRTPQGLLVEADFEGDVDQDCVRCLEPFAYRLHTQFTELFGFCGRRNVEVEFTIPDSGYIDLAPLTRDYMILELPIKPVCRPDCKGLCTYCGVNLNETTCEHQAPILIE